MRRRSVEGSCQNSKHKKTGVQWQDTGAIGGRKQGRLWPGNGPKSHRNTKEDISQTLFTHHQGHFSSYKTTYQITVLLFTLLIG